MPAKVNVNKVQLEVEYVKDEKGVVVSSTLGWDKKEVKKMWRDLFGCSDNEIITDITFTRDGITAKFKTQSD